MTVPSYYWIRSFIPSRLYAFLTRSHIPFTVDFRKLLVAKYLLKKGDTVIDGGAHVGYHSRYYANMVGERGRVCSFEPNPYVFKILNKFAVTEPNVIAERKALSDKEGEELCFYLNPRSLDQDSTLEERLKSKRHKKITVTTTTLDSLSHLTSVKLIKLDVEGHELAVFQGGASMIEQFRPWLIFEYQKNHTRDDVGVVAYLEEIGYSCFDLTTLQFFSKSTASGLTDLVALPNEYSDEDLQFINSLKYYN